tara:strand:+ start:543 stop:944 length:402 start_codon:yes stop_codon:yes gene_type:complete
MGKVLLIEDDEDNLFLFKTALVGSFRNSDILACDNFKEAEENFEQFRSEIILIIADHKVHLDTSDIFFNYVQKRNKKIPFIIVSASIPDSNDYLKKVRNSELHCFWQKPIPIEEIEEYIKYILSEHSAGTHHF